MVGAPAWYPDPNDAHSEIYWDGAKWHGRRQKGPPPIMLANWPAPKSSGVVDDFRRFWRMQSQSVQLIIILISISMVFGVAAFVNARPWESQRYKDCKAAAEYDGYQGKELDVFMDFCVGVH